METMIIDAFVENNLIKIPRKFNNRRVKVIIIDPEKKVWGKARYKTSEF